MGKQFSFINVFLIFLIVFFSTLFLLSLWAQVFAGNWRYVSAPDELPNALILASAITSFIVVLRNLEAGPARKYLLIGLAFIVLEVFFELPLKKYIDVFPAMVGITRWFFFFGLFDFLGMLLILLGFDILLKSKQL